MSATQKLLRFGLFELNLDTEELRKDGQLVKLAPQPFRILSLLAGRAGQIVPREEIRDLIWGGETYVDFDHGMNQCVKQIRGALNDNADAPLYLETIPRKGYRFLAPVIVKTVAEPPPKVVESKSGIQPTLAAVATARSQSSAAAGVVLAAPQTQSAEAVAELPLASPTASVARAGTFLSAQVPSRNKKGQWALFVGVALLAFLALFTFWKLRKSRVLSANDTVVLADFVNTTGDPVFDDAMQTGLSVELGQSPFLRPLSGQKVRAALKATDHSEDQRLTPEVAREVCRRTKSKAMITGTISDDGDKYLIQLEAVNCEKGTTLASVREEAQNRNQVVAALGLAATRLRRELGESAASIKEFDRPLQEASSPSPEALQAFTQALRVQGSGGDSVPYLQRALELDPGFANAYAALGVVYHNLGQNALSTENYTKAFENRQRMTQQAGLRIEAHYYTDVTGELEKAIKTYNELNQRFPGNASYHGNLSEIFATLGEFDKATSEQRETIRLMPGGVMGYSNLMYQLNSLDRLDESLAAFNEAHDHQLDSLDLHVTRYSLAFLQSDEAAMQEQVSWAKGKPKFESHLLSQQSDTEAYHGRIRKARDLSDQAIQSAIHAGEQEPAAVWKANAALREAEVGNMAEARRMAAEALSLSTGRNVELSAALTFARAGNTEQAQALVTKLNSQFPLDTLMQNYSLPAIRAAIAMDRKQPGSVDLLKPTVPYELAYSRAFASLYPAYLRGIAYLQAGQGAEAAAEFRKMLDYPGITLNFVTAALAHLQLARAQTLVGDKAAARKSYQDFLALWNQADPDVPIYKEAKGEYAKLQ